MNKLDNFTSMIPLIGGLIYPFRIILIAAVLLTLILSPIILIQPSISEKLVANSWCVDKIINEGQELTPNSHGLKMISDYANCSETMNFRENGIVDFPGIDSFAHRCQWELRQDTLYISSWQMDNSKKEDFYEGSIYHGIYKLEINGDFISMKSDKMILFGKKYNLDFRF